MVKKGGTTLNRYLFDTLLKGHFKTVYNRCGTIKYIPGTGKTAIVISSKQEKRAVYRNRIKRWVRNIFSQNRKDVDFIFYPSKAVYSLEYIDFKVLFDDILKKII